MRPTDTKDNRTDMFARPLGAMTCVILVVGACAPQPQAAVPKERTTFGSSHSEAPKASAESCQEYGEGCHSCVADGVWGALWHTRACTQECHKICGNEAATGATDVEKSERDTSSRASLQCIPNTHPDNHLFCMTSRGSPHEIGCRGALRVGDYKVQTITARCNNGRSWRLTCTLDGSLCNVSDMEFCVGLTQYGIGRSCTEPGARPNGG